MSPLSVFHIQGNWPLPLSQKQILVSLPHEPAVSWVSFFLLVLPLSPSAGSSFTTWPRWIWIPQGFGVAFSPITNFIHFLWRHLQLWILSIISRPVNVKLNHKFLSLVRIPELSDQLHTRNLMSACSALWWLQATWNTACPTLNLQTCLHRLALLPVFPDTSSWAPHKHCRRWPVSFTSCTSLESTDPLEFILPPLSQATSISVLKKFSWST